MVEPLDVTEIQRAYGRELARQEDALVYDGAKLHGKALSLAGVVRTKACLGLSLGDGAERRAMADAILACRLEDGAFAEGDHAGHINCLAVAALSLLGVTPPSDLPLAPPVIPDDLESWMDGLDWESTHKNFWGEMILTLANGRGEGRWRSRLLELVEARLGCDPRETWCKVDDPPWRVISSIYHIIMPLVVNGLPCPQPERLLQRLLDLKWEDAADGEKRTRCTDGDWAWCLMRLAEEVDTDFQMIRAALRKVSARRIRLWREDSTWIQGEDPRQFANDVWGTAIFRHVARDHYQGPPLYDVLNAHWLYRLPHTIR
jgi:hypothetical protein